MREIVEFEVGDTVRLDAAGIGRHGDVWVVISHHPDRLAFNARSTLTGELMRFGGTTVVEVVPAGTIGVAAPPPIPRVYWPLADLTPTPVEAGLWGWPLRVEVEGAEVRVWTNPEPTGDPLDDRWEAFAESLDGPSFADRFGPLAVTVALAVTALLAAWVDYR